MNNDLISRSDLLDHLRAKVCADCYVRKAGGNCGGCFIRAALDMIEDVAAVDAVEVVRCKDCIYWKTRHVRLNDGTERDYLPGEDYVDVSVGINVGSQCRVDCGKGFGYTFRADGDFCSRGMRKMDTEVEG